MELSCLVDWFVATSFVIVSDVIKDGDFGGKRNKRDFRVLFAVYYI